VVCAFRMYLITYSSVFKNSLPFCPPIEAAFLLRSLISHFSALAAWIFTDEACLPTACSRILLEKLTGFQLVKKFPAFHGTRRFITAFTRARHLSLSWANSIQSIPPHPTSWRSILTLSSHLRLGLPSGPLRFPHQNPAYASFLPHTRYMPRPSHSSLFYHPHNIGWGVQIIKPLIM